MNNFWLIAYLLLPSPTAQIAAPVEAAAIRLEGARVLRPAGNGWSEGLTLHISDGRIDVAGDDERAGDGAQVIDLEGLYLIPGLIDLHTHLTLIPYNERSWNDQVLKDSLELRTIKAVSGARATLEAGFTTIRELGTEGAGYADVALRDAAQSGWIAGPRIFAATRALVATGCYGPSGFDPRWDMPKGAQVADGPDGVRKAVREQIAAGADWIKVYADYRRRPGDASTPTYSLEELRSIVDEATSAGLPVAAHASTDEAIRRAVEAGVRTIEHGTDVTASTLELMRAAGVALCPTLMAGTSIARYRGWDGGAPLPDRVVRMRGMFERALASGVTIACGSDAGVFPHGANAREIELMVEWGMSPEAALRSATAVAAEVLGRGDELGRIENGYRADLVALAADPLENIHALSEPVLVIQGGALVLDRRR